MMMPSMVSTVRNLCATMARTAMVKASRKRPSAAEKRPPVASGVFGSSTRALLSVPASRVSRIISPSLSSITRWALLATCASCVTMMMV